MRVQLQAIKAAALAHLSSPGSPGRPMDGAGGAATLSIVGAPAGWLAAVDDGDEADLKRSSDQQRRGESPMAVRAGEAGRYQPIPWLSSFLGGTASCV